MVKKTAKKKTAAKKRARKKHIDWLAVDWRMDNKEIAALWDQNVNTVRERRKQVVAMTATLADHEDVKKEREKEPPKQAKKSEPSRPVSLLEYLDQQPAIKRKRPQDKRPLPPDVYVEKVEEQNKKDPKHTYNMTFPTNKGPKTVMVYESDGVPDYALYMHYLIAVEDQQYIKDVMQQNSEKTLRERYPQYAK